MALAHLSLIGILLRFLLGGAAVVAASLIAKRAGGAVGGIFAAFPAVFLAALLTMRFDYGSRELVAHSIDLSQGALIGMAINVACAAAAGYLCTSKGWKKGLTLSVGGWLLVSFTISYVLFSL
ncbi:hypothetical protein BK138_09695 [Paenibacillus rhizosphaerae]|uniref:DUF3147 domain-containing protein n=1 Tax=Paenibacillus rhizosphaerae TaxID=297318 RepID=A0A1R1F3R9_9BACL|nr:hypothetical protein BK138_09695 [Paenibacillus rhizosphaerae]OXL82542.1 hypothetical protein BCV73_05190 [Paenibacillus sp. SSG-1]GIO61419.1 hypothetical protein J43TS9_29930 [Paenibacillus cineris]